jgi:hypothetical protein
MLNLTSYNNLKKIIKLFFLVSTILVFTLLYKPILLNMFSDYSLIVFCSGDNENDIDQEKVNSLANILSCLLREGLKVQLSLDPSTANIAANATAAATGTVSVYAATKAATLVNNPFGKLAAFLSTFGFAMGSQLTLSKMIKSDPLFIKKVDIREDLSLSEIINKYNLNEAECKKVLESLEVSAKEISEDRSKIFDDVAKSIFEKDYLDFSINSIIETTSHFDEFLLGLIILGISGLYSLIAVGFYILLKEYKLEENY